MHIWKDKQGNKLTYKEFMKRFKEGVEGISPIQLTSQQLKGMNIIIIGLLCGIVVSLFNIKNLWWLLIILIGGLYVNVTQYIGTWQKKKALKDIEKQFVDFEKLAEKEIMPEPTAYIDLTNKDKGNKK